jgi:hypothetical protein
VSGLAAGASAPAGAPALRGTTAGCAGAGAGGAWPSIAPAQSGAGGACSSGAGACAGDALATPACSGMLGAFACCAGAGAAACAAAAAKGAQVGAGAAAADACACERGGQTHEPGAAPHAANKCSGQTRDMNRHQRAALAVQEHAHCLSPACRGARMLGNMPQAPGMQAESCLDIARNACSKAMHAAKQCSKA